MLVDPAIVLSASAMGIALAVAIAFVVVLLTALVVARMHIVRLSKSNEELRPFADFIRDSHLAVIKTDANRRIQWVNEAFTKSTGFTLEEIRGENPSVHLQCNETSQLTIAEMRRALDTQKGFHGELINCDKNGRRRWVELDIEPYFSGSGTLAGFTSLQRDITDRKAIEAALEESQALFNGALNASIVAVAILDQSGNVLFVNSKWRRSLGEADPSRKPISVGGCYFDSFSEAMYDKILNGIQRVVNGELPVFELEYQKSRAPTVKWHLLRITRFSCQDSIRLMATHEDITERKTAAEKLYYKKEKLRSVYNACSDGILLFDATGLFDANKSAMAIFGANSIHALLRKELSDFACVEGTTLQSVVEQFSQYMEQTTKFGESRFEYLLQDLDGRQFPAEIRLSTFQHFDERVTQATIRDNTERKANETRLQDMNRQLREDLDVRMVAEKTILETTLYLDVYRKIVDHHAIVSETNVYGNLIAVNDAFCQVSGYSREELIGRNHRILSSGVHTPEMWREMYRSTLRDGFWHGEICNRAKNGDLFWVDTTIAPLFNDAGELRGYFAIRANITSLKTAQSQAEAASRSKSEFLANMSHEIRTPMTAILGYADILDELGSCPDCQSSSQTKTAVETIQRNGEHLLAIINDILDISKIEADKMTIESLEVNLPVLMADLLNTMQVRAQAKGLELGFETQPNVPRYITTDPTRLRQILVNLIGNAIKFTEFGSVRVSARMSTTSSRSLLIDVIDSGIGMTVEQMSRLFGAFEQADTSTTRRFGGTGLGLRISKRLAEMLGGGISVAANENRGSAFTLEIDIGEVGELSRSQSTEVAALDTAQRVAGEVNAVETQADLGLLKQPLLGMNILLAEDGPDNQRLLLHHLRKAGATVQLVQNGQLAVEAMMQGGDLATVLKQSDQPDLVLMDMQMPIMDGYEATRMLRCKGVAIPIIALTAHAMDGDLQRCLDAGCNLRLTKPIDRTALIETCRSMRDGFAASSVSPVVPPTDGPEMLVGASGNFAVT